MRFYLSVMLLVCGLALPGCATQKRFELAPVDKRQFINLKAFPVGDNWAQVSWVTPRPADTVVEYGESENYGLIARDGHIFTGHRITLFDLKPETVYHYRVLSTDERGSRTVTRDLTFTTTPAAIGCETNPTGEPMGGGLGYSRIIRPEQATVVVKTTGELLGAFASAKPGDIVYVDDESVIDISQYKNIVIPGGITLASGRGRNGSVGGLIQYTKFDESDSTPILRTGGVGVRVTGLRFGGPSNIFGRTIPMYHMLYAAHYWTEIDNCEIWGWNYAAIETTRGTEGLYVHHNYFHHNTRLGCGYAINASVGVALVEGNLFDFHRHSIASSGWAPSSYEARCNLVMEHSISHVFDMHGAVDSEVRTNVGIWRFDEGRGSVSKDTSTYGNNPPTLHGVSDAGWVAGQTNSALHFNGKTWVDCTTGYKNNLGQKAFGIMGWIKPDRVKGTQALFSKATRSAGYSLRLVGPALEATVFDAGGVKRTRTAGAVEPGQWSHVALSFDGSRAVMFVNGEEVGSFACDGVTHSAKSKLTLGRDAARAASFYKGAMDEIRAYRAALKPADVKRNHIGQGDIAGVEMRIHHNTSRVAGQGSVCVRGKPAKGCWINDNWFYRVNDDYNIRQHNAKGNMFIGNNRYGAPREVTTGTAPTLSWAGKAGFKAAGVSPETGDGNQIYRFRVKYTDPNDEPPLPGYPRLILKRGGETLLCLTPLSMMPLDQKAFSKGRTYMCELRLPRGADYTYAFEALDMAGRRAVGEATQDVAGPVVTSGNAAPVLYPVMGEENYVENCVYPSNGTVDTEFDFRITFLDADNDAPQGGAPRVRITGAGGADVSGSPFAMKPITQERYINGRQFQLLTRLPIGEYKCEFVASDTQGGAAVNVRPMKVSVLRPGSKTTRTALTPFD
ncbi:MAG: LamG-like jellyroll fold domain-containing protein [Candidatus Sumerlaeia bacterium]